MIDNEKTRKTPVLRFKGFTDDWEQRKFSELVVTRRGLTYSPNDIRDNGVRVLRSSNIDEDRFSINDDDVFVGAAAVNIPTVCNGDILITSANGSSRLVGKHAIIDGIPDNSAVHGGFMLAGSARNPYFANALMSSSWYQKFINIFVAGGNGAIGNLNKNDLDEQLIMVPSKEEEQDTIGYYFRTLDSLITLHQKKCFLRSLSSFSIIAISWEQRKLGDLIIQGGSGGTPTATKSEYYGGTIPFLSIADIKDRDIKATEKTITETGLNNSAAWIVPKGAISLAMYASVGKVGILSMNSATSQAFFNMVFDNATIRNFVYYRLVKADFAKEWEPLISTGTQRNLNAEKVKKFSFCIPSIDEMKRVSDFLWDLDNLITLHQRKHGAGLYN